MEIEPQLGLLPIGFISRLIQSTMANEPEAGLFRSFNVFIDLRPCDCAITTPRR